MTHYITHSWEVKKVKDREATTEQEEAAAHFYKMGFMGVDEKEAQRTCEERTGEDISRHLSTGNLSEKRTREMAQQVDGDTVQEKSL